MSSNALNNALESVSTRYRTSPLPDFLSWWRGELAGLIPDGLRQRLVSPRPAVWLVADEQARVLTLWRGGEGPERLGELDLSAELPALRQRWIQTLGRFDDGAPEIRLCLPDSWVLACPVEQPLAVEANLGAALGYQLDQLTPFRAADVMFDYRVLDRNVATGRLALDLRLVPRRRLDGLTERLTAIGIRPHAIDTLNESAETPDCEGFNLLPADQRPRYVYARARLNWLLVAVAVVVLGLVMAQSLYLRNRTVEGLQNEVATLRNEAEQVLALQRQLEDSLLAANFLAERRRRQPVVIQVLDEVSRVLPDDMWINQMQVRGTELTMIGLADGSQRLIEIINDSPLLDNAEFRGAINVDPATGQERFQALATITMRRGDDATAAGSRE